MGFDNIFQPSISNKSKDAPKLAKLFLLLVFPGALIVYAVILYLKQQIRQPKGRKELKEDTDRGDTNEDHDEKETVLMSCQNGQSAVTILTKDMDDEIRKRHKVKDKEKSRGSKSKPEPRKIYSKWNYQYARMDRFFLFFFPFLFLIFNTLYWGYFSLGEHWAQYGQEG